MVFRGNCAIKAYFALVFFFCGFLILPLFSEVEETEVVIQGMILSSSLETAYPRNPGVHVFDVSLPIRQQKRFSFLLAKSFLGKAPTPQLFQELKDRIVSFYSAAGQPFVVVSIPEQEISDGIINVHVCEGKLGKVSVKGAHWFTPASYQSEIRLKQREPISVTVLQEDISWIDRNPFKSVEAVCERGEEPMATDISLIVKDRRPLRGFVGTDNTGFKDTGYQRAFGGLYIGNLFSLGQLFSYQYTTDYDFKLFQSHIASYEIPLPWRHVWSFFGGASFVRAPLESTGIVRSHGDSFQASSRYTIPFAQGGRFPQEIRFGCDFKRMNNNLVYGGQTISSKNVDIFQFLVEYKLNFTTEHANHDLSLEAVYCPGPWLPDMSAAAFDLLRPGAEPRYFYARGALKQLYRLPKQWMLSLEWAFQLSTQKLLASEQFGLGGYSTVRGYQERAVNTDNAFLFRFEPRFPPIFFPDKKMGSLVFFCYSDFGIGVDQLKLAPDYRTSQALWGIGPGFRYIYKNNISLRFDWGYQLTNIQNNPAGHNRINFGANVTL